MDLFLELEIVYIVIGGFLLSVTAFVTTREFVAYKEMPNADGELELVPTHAFKRGMLLVGGFVVIMISIHYSMTTTRMQNVKELFNAGETIICENKMRRTISRSVLLSKKLGWRIEGDKFYNDDYERAFHTSRCIEFDGIVPK